MQTLEERVAMSTPLSRLRRALLASCAVLLTFSSAAGAANRDGADLRVVAGGVSLVDQRQYTGPAKVRTSPRADCFGEGTGGSGRKVKLGDPNALGILKHAQLTNRSLRPLQITDAFDFGLGVCSIGGFEPSAIGYWYIKRNHVGSQAGGDGTPVRHGDDILWFLIEDFDDPLPPELEIKAPARVESGTAFTLAAFEYGDDGTRTPAAGGRIKGSGAVTDATGEAEIEAKGPVTRLRGVRDGAIPSNLLKICSLAECPPGQLTKHVGTNRADVVRTTRGQNQVTTLAGRDRIIVRKASGAAPPILRCGVGRDTVVAPKGQKLIVRGSCEKVKRR
jgi:hypothetical protein